MHIDIAALIKNNINVFSPKQYVAKLYNIIGSVDNAPIKMPLFLNPILDINESIIEAIAITIILIVLIVSTSKSNLNII